MYTVWLNAIQSGDLDAVKTLGTIPNWVADQAAHFGQLEILKWLRSRDAEWNLAAAWATRNRHTHVLQWIIEQNGPLHHAADEACRNGDLTTLQLILEHGGELT